MSFENKYLKYKNKYLNLKKQIGASDGIFDQIQLGTDLSLPIINLPNSLNFKTDESNFSKELPHEENSIKELVAEEIVFESPFVACESNDERIWELIVHTRNNNLDGINEIIEKCPKLDLNKPTNGFFLLIEVIKSCNWNILKKFIELGANPNIIDNDGMTPLMKVYQQKETCTGNDIPLEILDMLKNKSK